MFLDRNGGASDQKQKVNSYRMNRFIVDAVIFDLDGTLTDTEKYYLKAWPESLEHFGYTMEPWKALKVRSLGKPFAEKLFKEWYGEDFPYWEVREYRKKIGVELFRKEGVPLKPGAEEILKWLRSEGILVALATASNQERANLKLEKAGILQYFDRICCADMVERGKPAPDIYQFACKELQLPPERTFAVEDSPNGVRSAYEAGCKVIMVPDLSEPDEELKKMLYACVPSLTDLKKLV